MMNKEAIMEKLGEAKEAVVETVKSEVGFVVKGAFIGAVVAYSVRGAKVAYESTKEFVKETL